MTQYLNGIINQLNQVEMTATLENPIETPMETIIETPIETPIATPIETPMETLIETPIATPISTQRKSFIAFSAAFDSMKGSYDELVSENTILKAESDKVPDLEAQIATLKVENAILQERADTSKVTSLEAIIKNLIKENTSLKNETKQRDSFESLKKYLASSLFSQDSCIEILEKSSEETIKSVLKEIPELRLKERLESVLSNYCQKSCAISIEIVKKLVMLGADIEYQSGVPLQACIRSGHYEVAEYLLGIGADINADGCFSIKNRTTGKSLFFILANGGTIPSGSLDSVKRNLTKDYIFTCGKPLTQIIKVANIMSYTDFDSCLELESNVSDEDLGLMTMKDITEAMTIIASSNSSSKKELIEKLSGLLMRKL